MTNFGSLLIGTAGCLVATTVVSAQSWSTYRGFHLGQSLSAVAASVDVDIAHAKTIHERPARIQTFDWRPRYYGSGMTIAETDPVEAVAFMFYNDQLFQLVISYNPDRTEGMNDQDLIDAISETYGAPLTRIAGAVRSTPSPAEVAAGRLVARWGDAESSIGLYRSSDPSAYRPGYQLRVTSLPLEALARRADLEARQLDAREAPQREIERQKKVSQEQAAARAKARRTNKAGFRT